MSEKPISMVKQEDDDDEGYDEEPDEWDKKLMYIESVRL